MRYILSIVTLIASMSVFAQIDITNRTLCYDKLTKSYLCSVPETTFDDGSIERFTCDTATINFTFLPIVRLHGTFGYDYSEGSVDVIMPDGTTSTLLMPAKAKWRGGTTNVEGKHKRNYHIKFIDDKGKKKDRKFFGLRNDNNWLLDAAQIDMSRVRNRVATDLWNDFATKPYYFGKEPKALTGTRGQFVEVFLNDEYRGIYCMTENIDRSQVKVKKYTENADGTVTIHGQLWKGKTWEYSGLWNYGDYDNTSDTWGGLELKYPDIDDVNPTDWSTMYDCARFFTDCTFEDFILHRDEYVDMPVMIDYYMLITLLCAIDNHTGKNMFWLCYDTKEDKKLTPAVWDLDCTVGQFWDPANPRDDMVSPDNICYDYFWGLKPLFVSDSLDVNNYREQREARWKELRQTFFKEDALVKRYSDYMLMLGKAGAYRREKQRWDGDSDIAGRNFDFDAELTYIKDWLHRRLEVLDVQFPFCPYPDDGISDITIDKTNPRIYTIQGMRVPYKSKPGLYIKNGKKIIIR